MGTTPIFQYTDAWLKVFDLSTVDIPEVPVYVIEIYPIPAIDWVTISAPDSVVKRLQIYSLDGKLFYSNTPPQAEFQMDV